MKTTVYVYQKGPSKWAVYKEKVDDLGIYDVQQIAGPFKSKSEALQAQRDFVNQRRAQYAARTSARNHESCPNPRKRHWAARYDEPNPLEPETAAYIAASVGVLLFAGIGYWLYTKSQASAQVSSPSSYPVVQTPALPAPAPATTTNPTADYPVVQTSSSLVSSPLAVPPG
jgi:hypothetical protein